MNQFCVFSVCSQKVCAFRAVFRSVLQAAAVFIRTAEKGICDPEKFWIEFIKNAGYNDNVRK